MEEVLNRVKPPQIILIAALAENRVIGNSQGIPWHLPEELAFFKETTMGSTLIMGRKTYESIGRPLPKRKTIVVTRGDTAPPHPLVKTAGSLEEALALVETREVYVAGGGQLYTQALPLADKLILSTVLGSYEGDTYFPEVDYSEWSGRLLYEGEHFTTTSWVRRTDIPFRKKFRETL